MESVIQFFVLCADGFSGLVNVLFALVSVDESFFSSCGAIASILSSDLQAFVPNADTLLLTLAASTAVTYSDIPDEVLASARRWHGSIDEQFGNIDNLVVTIQGHSAWGTPSAVFSQIVGYRTQLATLIPKCRSSQGSASDRGLRNMILKMVIGLCLGQVRAWAYTQYYAGVLTLNDLHTLGFLLPGETGGHRKRAEATDILAEVKVNVVSADVIRVVIDQASDDNAALTVHGWPPGVSQAIIVITASDGVTEIIRRFTTHLYNDMEMPPGSHGKQFIAKASFLRHIDDTPRFGPQPTFTMPFTTEDLAAAVDHHHHEEFEAHLRAIELHRQELEQITANAAAAAATAAAAAQTPKK